MFPLSLVFRRLITKGTLVLEDPRGRTKRFGDGGEPKVRIRLHRRGLAWRVPFSPSLAIGEGYMDGGITIEDGDILDFLNLIHLNMGCGPDEKLRAPWLARIMQPLKSLNFRRRAKKNVAHHYEFTTEFYDQFLDENRQYSCAYFKSPNDSLEQAQRNKLDLIAGKLLLRPGSRVLDIGCGWGTLARHVNAVSGAHVTGITLSEEQATAARQMAVAEGKTDLLDFRVQDYRAVKGPFDRIVSVGMFEHVGRPFYPIYFRKIRELLADDGVALVHTIGRSDGAGRTNPWTSKYIFPGGYSPALSEILPAVERSGLFLTDVEVLRTHYARTTEQWYRRFQHNRDRIKTFYDERFCRMFEFFLAGCVGAFDYGGLVVFQLQLARRQDAVPLTRDYLYAG